MARAVAVVVCAEADRGCCPSLCGGIVVLFNVPVVGVRGRGVHFDAGLGVCVVLRRDREAGVVMGAAAAVAARAEQWVQPLEQAAPGPCRPMEPTHFLPRCWASCVVREPRPPVCCKYGLVGAVDVEVVCTGIVGVACICV